MIEITNPCRSPLQAVVIGHRLLYWGEFAADGKALDRGDRRAVGLHGELQAGADGLAIDHDGAGSADAVLAPQMRCP